MIKFSRLRISTSLTILALILWSYSITEAKFVIGKYGLISGFPVLFFVSLAILTLSSAVLWTSRENHWKLLLLQLCFLVISLFVANLISGGFMSLYAWGIGALGIPEFIIRTGHLNPNFWQFSQTNWPGSDILQSAALIFTGKNTENFAAFLQWLPVLWQSLFFFPVFVFFKNTIGKFNNNYTWAGMWIFYLASWAGLQTNGPQALGVLLAFTILAIFSSFDIWKQKVSSFGNRFVIVVIFAAIAVVHFLSSLVALSTVVGNFVSRRLHTYTLPTLLALFIVAWAIYGATVYNTAMIPKMATEIFRLGEALQISIGKSVSSGESHSAVSVIRVIFSGIIVLISILGILIASRQKQSRYIDVSLLCITIANCVVGAVVGSAYGTELLNRFFIYLLPILVYFGVKLLHYWNGVILLTVVLIICLPLSFVAQYGNQEMDYLTAGYINATDFFYGHTNGGLINGVGPLGLSQKAETYNLLNYEELTIEGDQVIIPTQLWNIDHYEYFTHYVSISDHDEAYLDFYENQPELLNELQIDLGNTVHCNLVFSNSDMSLYVSQAQPTTP